jgi:hypothetical protein
MALEEQVIEVSVASSVDETFGDWHIPADRLRSLTNAVIDRGGTVSKRKGVEAISYDTLPVKLGVYGDALVGTSKSQISVYSSADSAMKDVDKMAWQVITKKALCSQRLSTTTEPLVDAYAGSGHIVTASTINDSPAGGITISATVTDFTSWAARRYQDDVDATLTAVRVLRAFVVGTRAVVYAQEGANSHFYVKTLSPVGSTWTKTSYAADFDATTYADAVTDGTYIYLVGGGATALNHVKLRRFDPATATSVTQEYAETDTPTRFGINVSGGTLFIIYSRYNGATYDVYKMSITAAFPFTTAVAAAATTHTGFASAPTRLSVGFGINSAMVASIYAPSAPRARWSQYNTTTLALVASTSKSAPEYVLPYSRPFQCPNTSKTLQWVILTGINGGLFLVDLQTSDAATATETNVLRIAGVASPRLSTAANTSANPVQVSTISATQYLVPGVETDTVEPKTHIHAIITDFDHPGCGKVVGLGNLAYVIGGALMCFDGSRLFEAGYSIYPVMGTVTGNAGGTLSTGNYFWNCMYEWPDARGNMHRSGPSPDSNSLTVAPADDLNYDGNFDVVGLALTNRQRIGNAVPAIRIVPYRTKTTGTVLFRSPERTSAATLSPFNDVSDIDALYAVVDGQADTSIGDNPIIYTSGGVLDSVMPPCLRDIAAWKNRIFGIGEDGQTVWYTTEWEDGVAPWFNETFTFSVSDDDRELTAIVAMDDKLVLFKENAIYVVTGEPHQSNGLGSSLLVEKISNESGCTDLRSVVRGPDGIYFQSARGITLLTRDLRVEFVGAAVQAIFASYPSVVSACLHDKQSEVLFLCRASGGSDTVVLAYNYFWKAWIRRNYWSSTEQYIRGTAIAVHEDTLWGAETSGDLGLFREKQTGNATLYADIGLWVPLSLSFAWLKPDGLQGYCRNKRVWTLFESLTAHGISVSLYKDYASSPYQTESWTSTQVAALTREQFRIIPGQQKCKSFTAFITDVEPVNWDGAGVGGNGQGPRIQGARFLVGRKRGGFKNLAEGAKA